MHLHRHTVFQRGSSRQLKRSVGKSEILFLSLPIYLGLVDHISHIMGNAQHGTIFTKDSKYIPCTDFRKRLKIKNTVQGFQDYNVNANESALLSFLDSPEIPLSLVLALLQPEYNFCLLQQSRPSTVTELCCPVVSAMLAA